MRNIVIVGNGAAGNSAAETVRNHNQQIPIVMVAREELPEYSACALPDYLSGWVNRKQLFIKNEEDYIRQNIQTLLGREVRKIDAEHHILVTGREEIEYDRLILATGSRAVIPPVPGCDLPGNFVVKTVGDIEAVMLHQPRQVVVVGSGNIGIEVAEALHLRGCQVTVVELMDHILPKIFDFQPAELISKMLTEHGIQVLTGEKVLAVVGDAQVEEVATDQQVLKCDTVIWAAGVRQNVENARAAGVKIGELGGIQVDSRMQTSREGIYACGDCIESMDMLTGLPTLSLLWPNAKRQGQIAALNCLGQQVDYEGALSLVVEDIFGVTVVSMGMTSKALSSGDKKILKGHSHKQYWQVLLLNDRIVGVQAIGVTSGLGAVMALMKNRTTLSEFHHIIADPDLMLKATWYLPARQFLDNYLICRSGE